jgi:AraC-like DNA-binding protein
VQRLPARTDEPVVTIARRLSFPDPSHFGKFFTRHICTCPGTFRHIHQGQ